MSVGDPIPQLDALRQLRDARGETDVIITTMGTARDWMALGPLRPLDFVLVPSSMGGATSLGLGLALARPDCRVIVANGDGSMLMNLGSMVSITAASPANLRLIVFDNGAYEITGAQPTPGAAQGRLRGDELDYAAMARACGFRQVEAVDTGAKWSAYLPALLGSSDGPMFLHLRTPSVPGSRGPRSPGPARLRGEAFRTALASRRTGW